jgi:hypothetical protein
MSVEGAVPLEACQDGVGVEGKAGGGGGTGKKVQVE